MSKYFFIFSFLFLSCHDESNRYIINCCNDDNSLSIDHNGILFLVESANYQSLQYLRDTFRLKQYLSETEFQTAFDTITQISNADSSVLFKSEIIPWDTLIVNEKFIAELILVKDNTKGRGYSFQIRTYDLHHKLISAVDFAKWIDDKNQKCSGDFSKNNEMFTVVCGGDKKAYKFGSNGRIISDK